MAPPEFLFTRAVAPVFHTLMSVFAIVRPVSSVLPSVESSEAYGLVQLEAHACGKPVISTNLPTGVPFVNKDGVSGLVVPPKDVAALADALSRLLGDDALRLKLGAQAKERFENEFAMDVMIERLLDVYKEVLHER